jgi:hypothetical protein
LSHNIYVALEESGAPEAAIITVMVAPPNDPRERQRYFSALREQLRNKGTVREALFVFEGWTVVSSVRPTKSISTHPDRREVLGMMGRNSDKSRVTRVQQFFSRSPSGAIVWEEMPLAHFDVPATADIVSPMVEILDYLFPPLN